MGSKLYRRETGVFHCSAIKKYYENDDTRFPGRSHNRPPPVMTHGNKEWEVEAVEDHRKHYGKDQFLIKWKGYQATETSWELLDCLENAQEKINEWWKENKPGLPRHSEANYSNVGWNSMLPDVQELPE